MPTRDHTVRTIPLHVTRDLSRCPTSPNVADPDGCVRPLPERPATGQYRSHLGPILAMAERRLADRTAYVDLIAEAIVRQVEARR